MAEKGIIVKTDSGGYYVYNTSTNQIITLNAAWCNALKNEDLQSKAFELIEKSGIPVGECPDSIEWKLTFDDYLSKINNEIPSIILEITQECTLRCDYCIYSGNYENIRTHSNQHMDIATIKKCIDFYAEHNKGLSKAKISFYGGEALIRFDEIKFAVDYAHKVFNDKMIEFQISSNGTTLDNSVLEWLSRNKDVSVTVTVNGASHDKYRKFPSGKGSLEVIDKNLSLLKSQFPELWSQIDFIANIASFEELLNLRSYYIENIGKAPILISGILEYGGNDRILEIVNTDDSELVRRKVKQLYYEIMDDYISPYFHSDLIDIATRPIGQRSIICQETVSCMPFTSSLFISSTGDFGICERAGACKQLGNLYSGINTEFAHMLIDSVKLILNKKCRKCWCQRLCKICLKDFQIMEDGTVSLPEVLCKKMHKNVKNSLIMFCELSERNPEALNILQKGYYKK